MAIITMDGHLAPGEVHDRMPGLLSPDAFEDWLGDGLDAPELKKLLIDTSPSVAETVEYYPVSRAVNKVSLSKGIPDRGPEVHFDSDECPLGNDHRPCLLLPSGLSYTQSAGFRIR